MRPGLTLLCITKDQAPKLLRMLQSVQGVVDDMVVFDTGSKDLSPGVATVNGARVFRIDWPGSFSEALNVAMREVETEWTLRLDTDEWLPEGSALEIRRLMTEKGAFMYYFLRQDLSDDDRFSESWHVRMWRTDPELRFEGYIHEYFPDDVLVSASHGRKIFRVPVRFLHDGFKGGIPPEKHRRNIELLKRELAARPGELYYEVELAMTMIVLGDPAGFTMVGSLVERVLERYGAERPDPFVANLMGTALSHVDGAELGSARTQAMIDFSWKWYSACPPMLWAIAQAELRRHDMDEVYRALLQLEKLSESGDYEREWNFDSRILNEGLWDFLGRVARWLGHEDVEKRNRGRLARTASSPA